MKHVFFSPQTGTVDFLPADRIGCGSMTDKSTTSVAEHVLDRIVRTRSLL